MFYKYCERMKTTPERYTVAIVKLSKSLEEKINHGLTEELPAASC